MVLVLVLVLVHSLVLRQVQALTRLLRLVASASAAYQVKRRCPPRNGTSLACTTLWSQTCTE